MSQTHLGYKSIMFITFNFWKVRIRTPINDNFIKNIKYFPWHSFILTKNFASETHSESDVHAISSIISMNNLS